MLLFSIINQEIECMQHPYQLQFFALTLASSRLKESFKSFEKLSGETFGSSSLSLEAFTSLISEEDLIVSNLTLHLF